MKHKTVELVFSAACVRACVCVCVFACMCVCIVIYACTMSSACVDYLICTFSFLLFFLLQHSLSQCTCMCECVCSLINEIMFHPFSELFTGCPSKHVSNISCQHSVTRFLSPVYLSDLLRVYSPSRQLRSSSDSRTPHIPHIKTKTFGHCSFSHATPSVWNSLPHEIRHTQSTNAFKTALKIHLFKSYLY